MDSRRPRLASRLPDAASGGPATGPRRRRNAGDFLWVRSAYPAIVWAIARRAPLSLAASGLLYQAALSAVAPGGTYRYSHGMILTALLAAGWPAVAADALEAEEQPAPAGRTVAGMAHST